MEQIFVSYNFDRDRQLAAVVEVILRSHGIRMEQGDAVGGSVLTAGVMRKIDGCEGLIALMTKRERKGSGKYSTHPWVRDEYNHARTKGLPAIALIEGDVDPEGAYQEHERIEFNPGDRGPAYLKLLQTVGIWKRDAGVSLKVRIMPQALERKIGGLGEQVACRFSAYEDGKSLGWQDAAVLQEQGGVFAYLKGVPQGSLLRLQIRVNGEIWISEAVPQWMHVQLSKAPQT